MVTITLYDYIKSELIKQGFDEFKDENGKFVFMNEEYQFMTKILRYDEDVSNILDKVFTGVSLRKREYDQHFKRAFLSRFADRSINRQTIEGFRLQLLSTFLSNEQFLNHLYEDVDKYITQTQENNQNTSQEGTQSNDGNTSTDNRQAYAELPQNNINLDVDDTVMHSANDNTISRNKQTNQQETKNDSISESQGINRNYQFSELFKANGLLDKVLDDFDKKCFLQVW